MELADFSRQINSEVHDRIASGTDESPFSESVFTGIVLDYLSEIGMVDNPQVCQHDGRLRNATIRISGYSFSDDGDRLDLFVTVFRDQSEPASVPREELVDAAQQAARFYKAVTKGGYASQLDPSSEAFQLAAAIMERRKEIKGFVSRICGRAEALVVCQVHDRARFRWLGRSGSRRLFS